TAEEALTQVHQELGADAVVVEIRRIAVRGLFSWLSRKTVCEVTATKASDSPAAAPRAKSQRIPTVGTVAAAAVGFPGAIDEIGLGDGPESLDDNAADQ